MMPFMMIRRRRRPVTPRAQASSEVEGAVSGMIRVGYSHPYAVAVVTRAVGNLYGHGWAPQGGYMTVGRNIPPQTIRMSGGGVGQSTFDILTGKGQAYYTRLDSVQNRVIGIQAEMSEIGKDAWDSALWSNLSDVSNAGYDPVDNYLFDPMMEWWKGNYKQLLKSANVEPSEATITEVERLAGGTDKLIAFVKRFLPQAVADAATAYRKEAIDKVDNYRLTSPTDVAYREIEKEINQKLGGISTTLIIAAAVVAAAAAGAYAFFGRKRG